MPPLLFEPQDALHVLVATLGGFVVGMEREWSGKAAGEYAHFGGLRTFTLLGGASGICGWLWMHGLTGPALLVMGGLSVLVAISYAGRLKHNIEATTEFAAFVVMAAGILAGGGAIRAASGIAAATVFVLVEKRGLHAIVAHVDDVEMRAGVRFLALALVILPLLPEGPFGPLGGVKPRQLWILVLFLSGLSFLGYIARRAVGNRGYVVTGLLGGLVSSTSTTLSLSTISQREPGAGRSLAAGTLAACVVMLPRVVIVAAVLAPALAQRLWPMFLAPAAIGIALALTGLRAKESTSADVKKEDNPLQLWNALKLTVIFQLVLFAITYAQQRFGTGGFYASAALIGSAEMDAVVLSVAKAALAGTPIDVAARAIALGAACNSVTKAVISIAVGRGAYRPLAAIGLILMALSLGAAVLWWR